MDKSQPTFSDLELQGCRRVTRRQRFLDLLDEKVPWGAWAARVGPFYPKAGGGRPPVPLGTMLRMYAVQVAFDLSDEGAEDAVTDSRAVRAFVGCGESPDATTLCRFRRLLEDNGLGRALFEELNASLEAEGLRMSTGTIVDATFVEAPSSTKNARRARDPEARSSKKGKNWHFGYKAHVGVDAEAGTVHTLRVTPANASDLSQAAALVRPGDTDVWADAGHVGVAGWLGGCASPSAEWHVARRKGSVPGGERPAESLLASTRSRVEHAFHALKDLPGFRKTRCRASPRSRTACTPPSPRRTPCSPRGPRGPRGLRPARRTRGTPGRPCWACCGRPRGRPRAPAGPLGPPGVFFAPPAPRGTPPPARLRHLGAT